MGSAHLPPRCTSGLILAFLGVAFGILLEVGCRASKPLAPSDQDLISLFYTHHRAFDQLQQMAAEDARRNWYLGNGDLNKVEQSRRDAYKNLTSEIRPGTQVAMNGTTGVVRFIFAGEGVAIGPDWVKGIEYVPGDSTREGVLLPDLNKESSLPADVYLREIEPRWFIFYQRDE